LVPHEHDPIADPPERARTRAASPWDACGHARVGDFASGARERDDRTMELTGAPTIAAATSRPNQPNLPGLEDDVVARTPDTGFGDGLIKVRSDRPIDAPPFAAFDQAVDAARSIMQADRKDARWGLFHRHAGPVDAIALVEGEFGVRLLRTNYPVDRYKEPVPGQMFPGQNWEIGVPPAIVRERPTTLAIVGADSLFDLRAGTVAGPAAFPKR
jgi:hypothetical protein